MTKYAVKITIMKSDQYELALNANLLSNTQHPTRKKDILTEHPSYKHTLQADIQQKAPTKLKHLMPLFSLA